MPGKLKIALIQQEVASDIERNRKRGAEAFAKAARDGARLIAFPELAFTPFYPQRPAGIGRDELAEPVPGPTTDLFRQLAEVHRAVAVVNFYELHGGKTFDTTVVIDAGGAISGMCRMVHIVEAHCFHEKGYYTPGENEALVFSTAVGRVGIATCYDRHYPEYMRRLALEGAEIVVTPQAGSVGEWPEGLFEAEMRVASFQNGYFSALCNRVGREECLTFEGKSFVVDPDGRIIAQAPALTESVLAVEIDLDKLARCHARRHFLPDRRPDVYARWFT